MQIAAEITKLEFYVLKSLCADPTTFRDFRMEPAAAKVLMKRKSHYVFKAHVFRNFQNKSVVVVVANGREASQK